MRKLITPGIILSSKSFSNRNRQVKIFSRDLGKIKANLVSGAKMKSKLSPHLDPLNFSSIRLVKKHRFTVTDAFVEERFDSIREDVVKMYKALDILYILESLLPEMEKNKKCWDNLLQSFKGGDLSRSKFLKILGYDPTLASCFKCSKEKIENFFPEDQIFLCKKCRQNFPNEKLVQLNYE